MTSRVPRALEWPVFPVYLALAAAAAAVCVQINVHLGVTPNTAVVGVVAAIALGRTAWPLFRSAERQVLVETATSAGGFAGANIALISLAVLYLLGLERLWVPLVVGITLGMTLDIYLASRLFGSTAFPAEAPWPDGEAVGRVIQVGDRGGAMASELMQGMAAGLAGRLMGLPMAGIGIAFIGNPAALAALAAGLLARGAAGWVGVELSRSYLPHGLMIGAGLVQAVQTAVLIGRSRASWSRRGAGDGVSVLSNGAPTRHLDGRELVGHLAAFVAAAATVSVLAGLWSGPAPPAQIVLWIGFAGAAALLHTVIVGYCAMQSGWFPSFAVGVALVLVAALLRFPLEALALLAGYVMATGPQFADLGYDLKSGWIVRGRGADAAREREGRREQVRLQQIGALVGLATACVAFSAYWQQGLVPPMGRALAATVSLAATPALASDLALGGLVGVVVQVCGGARRALGVLLATGLLLNNPIYGVALAAALAVRAVAGTTRMSVRAPGLIAGDGLAGFAASMVHSL